MNSRETNLFANYKVAIDRLEEEDWYKVIGQFSDANIYQTWAYDAVRCGHKNLSHLVLSFNGKIVAAAQVRLAMVPFIGLGAAYVRWGPLWRLRGAQDAMEIFRMAIRALRNEYVCRRGLILRVYPVLFDDENSEAYLNVLHEEGFTPTPEKGIQRTLLLDLAPSLEDIRKDFRQKWRNCLNKAERGNLAVVEGTEDDLFDDFIGLYRELLDRKDFKEPNDINEFRGIQHSLPSGLKMGLFVCRTGDCNSAGVICAAIGETGVYLFGATNEIGMKNKGSYLLQWQAIKWMKENGCKFYNLNGINPKTNPGSYHFKSGISGKNGRDVRYLGRFDCYSSAWMSVFARIADGLLPLIKRMKFIL